MMKDKSIVLIGFMGVGKTTVGKELANKLGWEFVDTDEEIEKQFGMTTMKIFATYGEETFRKKEKETIIQFSRQWKKVISVGGGAFLQEDIRKACMENTNVVHLAMSYEAWQNRLPDIIDSRPVLHGKDMDEIKELFDERNTIYGYHHFQLIVDQLTPQEAATAIINQLALHPVD